MKLFYDNLVPFMPNSIVVNEQRVPDVKLEAARKAMIMLSEFQRFRDATALYEAVYQISIYADVSIVDLIFAAHEEEIKEGTVDGLLDIAAKNLFKTISPDYEPGSFDPNYFTAILLSIAHTVLVIKEQYAMEQKLASEKAEETAGATDEPEVEPQTAPE